mmetsp:Transcript_8704/g.15798  ORF Transcript_8704/g.15798 Transcript_8704/m.15798 type:complete len:209 (+) Transcript_8704:2036-2662(+)
MRMSLPTVLRMTAKRLGCAVTTGNVSMTQGITLPVPFGPGASAIMDQVGTSVSLVPITPTSQIRLSQVIPATSFPVIICMSRTRAWVLIVPHDAQKLKTSRPVGIPRRNASLTLAMRWHDWSRIPQQRPIQPPLLIMIHCCDLLVVQMHIHNHPSPTFSPNTQIPTPLPTKPPWWWWRASSPTTQIPTFSPTGAADEVGDDPSPPTMV